VSRGAAGPDALWEADAGARAAPLRSLDARLRVLATLGFAVVTVSLERLDALLAALGLALALVAAARVPWPRLRRALLAVDGLMVLVVALLPFTTPGAPVAMPGGLEASREGLVLAAAVALKANAVVLASLALVGTLDAPALGHALHHLRVPARLVDLLLFTVRYLSLLEREQRRLRMALKARAFTPRPDLHTWRTLGLLVGMLLVRALARAERVLAAMRCRGFDGSFHRVRHPRARRRDWVATGALAMVLAALGWWGHAP
jgi:cobalt/nickel transport system permease protein